MQGWKISTVRTEHKVIFQIKSCTVVSFVIEEKTPTKPLVMLS